MSYRFLCVDLASSSYSQYTLVVPYPGVRVTVAESPSRNLVKVSEWCDILGMKLNASNTKTMIVFMSCTIQPQSQALTIGGTVMKELVG